MNEERKHALPSTREANDEPKQELYRTLSQLLKSIQQPSREPARWARILNSPFVLTILGGLFISLITSCVQDKYAQQKAGEARAQAIHDRKLKVIADFSEGVTKYLGAFDDLDQREQWLWLNSADDKARDPADGKSYGEEMAFTEELRKNFAQIRSFESLWAEAYATFDSDKLHANMQTLEGAYKEYAHWREGNSKSNRVEVKNAVDKAFDQVILAMGEEIRMY